MRRPLLQHTWLKHMWYVTILSSFLSNGEVCMLYSFDVISMLVVGTSLFCGVFGMFLSFLEFCKSGEKYSLHFDNKHIFRKLIMSAIDYAYGQQFLLEFYMLNVWLYLVLWLFFMIIWQHYSVFFICKYSQDMRQNIRTIHAIKFKHKHSINNNSHHHKNINNNVSIIAVNYCVQIVLTLIFWYDAHWCLISMMLVMIQNVKWNETVCAVIWYTKILISRKSDLTIDNGLVFHAYW